MVQVGFGILVGLDFQMYVNVHQGNQSCIWFSFKLVVGEFLKQKQCWAKAWLLDFQEYFRCWKMKDNFPYQVLFKSTLLHPGAGSRGFREFGCQATFKLSLFCADHIWFSVFFGCGSWRWRWNRALFPSWYWEHLPQRLWFNQLTSASFVIAKHRLPCWTSSPSSRPQACSRSWRTPMGTRASRIFSDLFVDLQASEKIPVVALVFVLDVFYSFELTVHESSHLTVIEF